MNILYTIKTWVHRIKDYPSLWNELRETRELLDKMLQSDKIVFVYPRVEIQGINKTKGTLFLSGDNLDFGSLMLPNVSNLNLGSSTVTFGGGLTVQNIEGAKKNMQAAKNHYWELRKKVKEWSKKNSD